MKSPRIMGKVGVCCAGMAALTLSFNELQAQPPLRMNEIQCLGSHNSYRMHTDPRIERFVLGFKDLLPDDYNPEGWDYHHLPLKEQLGMYGMRSLELDIYHDPAGGRYAKPAARLLTGRKRKLADEDWQMSGMKLMHIADFDYNTHHVLFKDALIEVRDWSVDNPGHLPITVMVEMKTFGVGSIVPFWPFTTLLPFDRAALDDLETEISEVFAGREAQLFRPDDFRGSHADLGEARIQQGWPEADSMRGKIIFVAMMSEEENRAYRQGNPNLESRNMFIFGDGTNPDDLFVKIDDPRGNEAHIQDLVRQGFIVRTRADADTREARSGETGRLESAIHSGAQIISTDYYLPDPRAGKKDWSHYRASLPEGQKAMPNATLRPDWKGKPVHE